MCSTALSAVASSSFINWATTSRPSSRAGGDLQTFAVIIFCRFVEVLVDRTARKASQMRLILEDFARVKPDAVVSFVVLSVGILFSNFGMTRVSLYIVWVTSSSLY